MYSNQYMNRRLVILLGLLAGIVAGVLFVFVIGEDHQQFRIMSQHLPESRSRNPVQHYSYFAVAEPYEKAYVSAGVLDTEDRRVFGGIVPHHLIVADRIADWYGRLRNQKVKTVVVVGPNHFGAGSGDVLSSRGDWVTPYGTLEPDIEMVERMQKAGLVGIEEEPFEREHSITAHVAFIKRMWPGAQVVPLIVKWGTPDERVRRIAESLAREDVFVIASVDFSHHQPWWVADFHDEMSLSVLASFSIEQTGDMEVDSPASIALLLRFLEAKGAGKEVRVDHTNTVKLIGQLESTENTTHVLNYFVVGEPESRSSASMLLFPDMMLGRNVASLSAKGDGFDYPFQRLEGIERQFFRGFNLLVANLEGPITSFRASTQKSISFGFDPAVVPVLKKYGFDLLSLANNHGNDQGKQGLADTRKYLDQAGIGHFGDPLREDSSFVAIREVGGMDIAFVGFNLTDHRVDDTVLTKTIQNARASADLVVVFVHWGAEYSRYPTNQQKEWGKLFIDSGADVVVGHHPHVVETVEVYNNHPIFYSLGNFIFDQYFSKETQEGLGVGAVAGAKTIKYYLIPYTIPKSQPTLMGHAERQIFLQNLARDSKLDDVWARQVVSGVLEFMK